MAAILNIKHRWGRAQDARDSTGIDGSGWILSELVIQDPGFCCGRLANIAVPVGAAGWYFYSYRDSDIELPVAIG